MRELGNIGEKDTENEVLLLEHDVPHCNFSQAVLSCLPEMPWTITDEVRVFFYPPNLFPEISNLHYNYK